MAFSHSTGRVSGKNWTTPQENLVTSGVRCSQGGETPKWSTSNPHETLVLGSSLGSDRTVNPPEKYISERRRLGTSKTKTLVLGSSLLKGTKRHISINEAYIACRPGATTETIQNEVDNCTQNNNIETIILHVGGNDLSSIESSDHLIGELWNLVITLRPNSLKLLL